MNGVSTTTGTVMSHPVQTQRPPVETPSQPEVEDSSTGEGKAIYDLLAKLHPVINVFHYHS